MSTIEPGQYFWQGPRRHPAKSTPLDGEGRIPDSPALPAIARLLADPATVAGLVELLTGVDWHYETPEAERAGRALLAALEGDQAATVAANGGEK